jgi:hypothetical protein
LFENLKFSQAKHGLAKFRLKLQNEAVPKLQFLEDKQSLSTGSACPASANLVEKPGRDLVRFDRFFQEPRAQDYSIEAKVRTMRFSA